MTESESQQDVNTQLQLAQAQISQQQAQISQQQAQISQQQAQISQLQDTLSEHVESASQMSQAKKRQKMLTWADILQNQSIDEPTAIDCLCSPHTFYELSSEKKLAALSLVGLDSELDKINTGVAEALGIDALPSPSSMSVDDVRKILHGSLPSAACEKGSIEEVTSQPAMELVMSKVEKIFYNISEQDATTRVIMCVIDAAWDSEQKTVKLQPSLFSHPVFTDIIFLYGPDGMVKGFIEIKKVEMNTNLILITKATAQALREAHVLILEKNMDSVVFALTNGYQWSFAKAIKYGIQIKLNQIFNLHYPEDLRKILRMLKYIMKGEWPQL